MDLSLTSHVVPINPTNACDSNECVSAARNVAMNVPWASVRCDCSQKHRFSPKNIVGTTVCTQTVRSSLSAPKCFRCAEVLFLPCNAPFTSASIWSPMSCCQEEYVPGGCCDGVRSMGDEGEGGYSTDNIVLTIGAKHFRHEVNLPWM